MQINPSNESAPSTIRWRILLLLLAYSFMSWFNRVSMSVAGDEAIMKDYGIDETEMGLVYSALLFSYACFMTPGGWFADRFGGWKALVLMGLGSAVFGAMTGLTGLVFLSATSLLVSLVVVRGCMGIFTAPIYPASGQVIRKWFPFPDRAWANGLVMAAALVGISSTFFGFGSLIDWIGWENSFFVTGTITAFVALIWIRYASDLPQHHASVNQAELLLIHEGHLPIEEPSAGENQMSQAVADPVVKMKSAKWDWLVLFRNRSLVLLTISYAAVGYFEYLSYFWIRHYFEKVLLLDKDASRINATIVNLSMAFGMFGGGWLADRLLRRYGLRIGRTFVPIAGMLAGGALLILGLVVEDPFWIVILFSLALATVGASEGPLWATAIDLGGKRGGTAAGIFNTGGNAGGILAPVLTPLVAELWDWTTAISLASVFCFLGVILFLWIDPQEKCADD